MALIAVLVALSVQPDHIVLGQDHAADLTVSAPAGARVEITTSIGSITDVRRDGNRVRARFVPPRAKSPAVALLLAVIDEGGDRTLEWLALPLWGSDTLELETRPGASVEASIGKEVFGPVTADHNGTARIAVVVPPGVRKGLVKTTDKVGNVNEKEIDLEPPPFPRMRLAARSSTATAGEPLEVEVFAFKRDGTPEDAPFIALEGGAQARRRWGGAYVAEIQPPANASSMRASLPGGPSVEVPVVKAPPGSRPRGGGLAGRREWAISGGLLVGGGLTFDGAGGGNIYLQGALRLGNAPIEAFVELGGGVYTEITINRGFFLPPLKEDASTFLIQAGMRVSQRITRGLDGHVALFAGLHDQQTKVTPGTSSSGWNPRFGLLAGIAAAAGPGRVLVELRGLASPSGVAAYDGSLAGIELTAGYLLNVR